MAPGKSKKDRVDAVAALEELGSIYRKEGEAGQAAEKKAVKEEIRKAMEEEARTIPRPVVQAGGCALFFFFFVNDFRAGPFRKAETKT